MQRDIEIKSDKAIHELFGRFDENIKIIENKYGVHVIDRSGVLSIVGDEDKVDLAHELIVKLLSIIERSSKLDLQTLEYTMHLADGDDMAAADSLDNEIIVATPKGKFIKPKTKGQLRYCNAIESSTITFGIGPAGTGKTYLAVAEAVKAFKNKDVSKIVITRPAIEAGERLGFLPGDLQMKVDPYLRPLYDSLYDIMGAETYLKLREKGVIEVAPLAYMRGRTLDDSFIILDEAQNTTKEQMKMFLTRFGYGSRVVVNGDITQIDLDKGRQSGLIHAMKVLKNINDITFVTFDKNDVVRHSLVKKIIARYDSFERGRKTDV